jgi:hypothetical protein
MIEGATVWTCRRVMELETRFVGVMDPLLKAALNEWWMPFHVSSLHGFSQL